MQQQPPPLPPPPLHKHQRQRSDYFGDQDVEKLVRVGRLSTAKIAMMDSFTLTAGNDLTSMVIDTILPGLQG